MGIVISEFHEMASVMDIRIKVLESKLMKKIAVVHMHELSSELFLSVRFSSELKLLLKNI